MRAPLRTRRLLVLLALIAATLQPFGAGADAPDPDRPGARPEMCPGGVLAAHDRILITNDAGLTPENGVTGGSGTEADPYVIGCLSIAVTQAGSANAGIRIASSSAITSWIVVRDVEVTGPATPPTPPSIETPIANIGGSGNNMTHGISVGSYPEPGADPPRTIRPAVEHVTGRGLGQAVIGGTPRLNLLEGNENGITGAGGTEVVGNVGLHNRLSCITGSGSTIRGNTCIGRGTGTGITASGEISGNLVAGHGTGYQAAYTTGTVPHFFENIARRNGTGFSSGSSSSVGQGLFVNNLIEENGVGIDITVCHCVIRGNTIVNNSSAGIMGFVFGAPVPLGATQATIIGNRLGGNPYGMVFEHTSNSNVIAETEWLDGNPSFLDFGSLNSIVDAGSDQRGTAGEPIRFHDYIARVTLGGNADWQPTGHGVAYFYIGLFNGSNEGFNWGNVAVQTEVGWDFGDGHETTLPPDALQGHGSVPLISHTYVNPGTYEATLRVSAIDNLGREYTLTDTVPVTIEGA